jgi:hypothetical protein
MGLWKCFLLYKKIIHYWKESNYGFSDFLNFNQIPPPGLYAAWPMDVTVIFKYFVYFSVNCPAWLDDEFSCAVLEI